MQRLYVLVSQWYKNNQSGGALYTPPNRTGLNYPIRLLNPTPMQEIS